MRDAPCDHKDLPTRVSEAVCSQYYSTVKRRGPVVQNGSIEWTILAGVCLVIPQSSNALQETSVVPIAIGTGTKALPYSLIRQARGDVLHDGHAEVVARRGARRWMCERLMAEHSAPSEHDSLDGLPRLFETAGDQTHRRRLRTDVQVWWYISTLPCGECSTPSLLRRQQAQDASSAFSRSISILPQFSAAEGSTVRGRYTALDSKPTLRTVPGRADSPPSISHSCTDKLLLWSLVGWQGAALSRWLEPLPINAIVISSIDGEDPDVTTKDVRRGLDILQRGQALAQLPRSVADTENGQEPPGLGLSPNIHVTSTCFAESQAAAVAHAMQLGLAADSTVPSWMSVSWLRPSTACERPDGHSTAASSNQKAEKIVNGIRQGASMKRQRLSDGLGTGPLPEKSRSRLCKLEMLRLYLTMWANLETDADVHAPATYADLKGKSNDLEKSSSAEVLAYQERKAGLRGSRSASEERIRSWVDKHTATQATSADNRPTFVTEAQEESGERSHEGTVDGTQTTTLTAPMSGWLLTPMRLEHFDRDGCPPAAQGK